MTTTSTLPSPDSRDEDRRPSNSHKQTIRSRVSWYSKRGLLSMLSVLVALLTAEGCLRLLVEQEMKRLASYDQELGWRGKPHGHGLYIRSVDNIRVPFAYNNLGFRDEHVTEKGDRGSPRLLLLGDSFLESLEMEYADIFHELIETRLEQEVNRHAEVVAVGSQGYSTAQELRAFRAYGEVVNADIVLTLFYSGNDFEDNLRRQFAYLEDGDLHFPENRISPMRVRMLQFQRWLYEHSHLVFLVKNCLQSWTNLNLQDPSKLAMETDAEYEHQISTKLLQQTQLEVERSGSRFGVVLIPSRDEIGDRNLERVHAVAEFCANEKIPCLQLELSAEHFFETDIHLNRAGHEMVADQIFQFVTREFASLLQSQR